MPESAAEFSVIFPFLLNTACDEVLLAFLSKALTGVNAGLTLVGTASFFTSDFATDFCAGADFIIPLVPGLVGFPLPTTFIGAFFAVAALLLIGALVFFFTGAFLGAALVLIGFAFASGFFAGAFLFAADFAFCAGFLTGFALDFAISFITIVAGRRRVIA